MQARFALSGVKVCVQSEDRWTDKVVRMAFDTGEKTLEVEVSLPSELGFSMCHRETESGGKVELGVGKMGMEEVLAKL